MGYFAPVINLFSAIEIGGDVTPFITTGSGPGPTEKCGLN